MAGRTADVEARGQPEDPRHALMRPRPPLPHKSGPVPGCRYDGAGAPAAAPPPPVCVGGMTNLEGTAGQAATGSAGPEPVVAWLPAEEREAVVAARRPPPRPPGARRRRRTPASNYLATVMVAAAGLSGAATVGSATGAPIIDRMLRGGLAAAVTAAAVTAPTWAILVLAGGAAGLGWTGGPLAAGCGTASLALAVVLAWKEDVDRHLLKAASAALATAALLRVPGGVLGATAAAFGALALLTVLTGLRRGHRRWRRRAALAAAAVVGLGAVASVLGVLAGLEARSSFERSSTRVATALSAAQAGDGPQAAASARAATADLGQARSAVGAWWVRPAWAVPVVGAHLRAAERVAGSAGPAVEAAAASADALRLDVLRPESGRLDLDRIAAAAPQLDRLNATLDTAARGAAQARSPWLVAPLQTRLQRYDTELAEVTVTAHRAQLAVRSLPALLGRDRPTRWLIAVANPAETRELGGFFGDYVVMVADRGALRLERSGSVAELGASLGGRDLQGVDLPERFRSQKPELYWQNVTGYPDLPTVATAARSLWDQVAPGSPLDGVGYVDPHGLAALLRLTGPVTAPAPLGTLTADNAAQLLLVDQYALFSAQGQRKDALNDASRSIFSVLSTLPLPAPSVVGAALSPAVRGGHLAATSFSAEGQELFDEVGASGRLPVSDGGDLASLRTTNLVENKLDAHLRRSVRYQAVIDPAGRQVRATATIEMRSDATTTLPDYVAANRRGLPKATNLLEVAWYSGLRLEGIEVDGRPVTATSDRERGWWTHSTAVQVPAGGATTVTLRLAGPLAGTRPYRLAVAPQAASTDDRYAVEVVGARGWVPGPFLQPAPGRRSDLLVPMRRR